MRGGDCAAAFERWVEHLVEVLALQFMRLAQGLERRVVVGHDVQLAVLIYQAVRHGSLAMRMGMVFDLWAQVFDLGALDYSI